MQVDQNVDSKKLLDRIWRTYKCRTRAEARYRAYNLAAHFFTSYYSLLVIFASIFSAELTAYIPATEKTTIALSVAVFSLSLVLYGFRFSETADKHRECYLRLRRILDGVEQGDIAKTYHDILEHYPNHSSADYNGLIVEQAFFLGDPLKDVESGQLTRPSKLRIFLYCLRRGAFWIATILGILMPFIGGAAYFYSCWL